MPKALPPSRPDRWRAGPYGAWISPSLATQSHSTPVGARLQHDNFSGYRSRSHTASSDPPTAPRAMGPYDAPAHHSPAHSPAVYRKENMPQTHGREFTPNVMPNGPPSVLSFEEDKVSRHPQNAQESQKDLQDPVAQEPQDPPQAQSHQPTRLKRGLTRVARMSLQAVSRTNRHGRQQPGLRIHSYGGGIQSNVWSNVPATAQTIAFNIEDEEALLKAYRNVKAMNPSAAVGGIMFSVATKAAHSSMADNLSWDFLAGRHGRGGRITINLDNKNNFRF
ncbi:hypothetical protein F53441_4226 [Fusarium austroafricanum]|uniref:Uncharacterized protein n=1 Tax=Fusarium austroafricanum TaxID=2364996 RepID=A0A8H4KKK8_9HYPO|nr:hypothetical protein F53441_4226 [Fusarium austroafricanum]